MVIKMCFYIFVNSMKYLWVIASLIWDSCVKSHLNKIQIYQNKILRIITDAPWFVRNKVLHNDLKIPTIDEHINHIANRFFHSLTYSNGAAHYNLNKSSPKIRRLRRRRPHDRSKWHLPLITAISNTACQKITS